MKEQKSFKKKVFHNGSYSIFISIAVVAILIVVNLMIKAVPSHISNIDFSEQSLFSISDKTESILKNLDEDVTIYFVAQPGSEDPVIVELLEKYNDLSSHIKVKQIDTAVNPTFAQQYTQEGITDNSFVVESKLRYQVISNDNIYVQNNVTDSEGNAHSYESFEGESALTSAIDYVTSKELPIVYTLSGHAELPLNDKMLSYLKGENIEIKELSIAVNGEIPEDCACLIVNAPEKDISEDEQEIITDYVDDGGHLLYVKNINSDTNTRMDAVAEYFGITIDGSLVFETDTDYMYLNQGVYLLPIEKSHVITDPLIENNVRCMMPYARRLILADDNELVETTALLTTSSKGYADDFPALDGQKDAKGTMTVAAAAEGPERMSGKETKVVVIASDMFLDSEINEYISEGNYDLVINAIGWMCEHESSIAIRSKTFLSSAIFATSSQANALSIVLTAVVPVIVMVVGIVVWVIRRRR